MAINDNILGYWLPAGVSDVTAATIFDHCTGNHLVNNGITQGAGFGIFGTASASATNRIHQINNATRKPAAFTLYCEARLDTISSTIQPLMSVWSTTSNQRSWLFYVQGGSPGVVSLSLSANGSTSTTATAATVTTATWYKFMAVWDGATMTVYVDGVAGTPVAFASSLFNSSEQLRIGRMGPSTNFDGDMRNVMMWTRALSAGEITGVNNGSALPTRRTPGTRNIVLLMGQSNAVGEAPWSALSAPVGEDRHFHNCWCAFNDPDPTKIDWSNTYCGKQQVADATKFGPEIGMAEILDDTGDQWGIAKYAVGNTGLDDSFNNWYPGDTTYAAAITAIDGMLADLQTYGETPLVRGVVWDQGESDANQSSATANAYEANLAAFIAALRAEYVTDMPFIIQRLSSEQNYDATRLATVRAAQMRNTLDGARISIIDNDANTLLGDNIHYGATAQIARGIEAAEILLATAVEGGPATSLINGGLITFGAS